MTGFSIPPPPKTAPGVLTLGQVLDGEKAADGPMTVEVVVTVDQEQMPGSRIVRDSESR